MNSATMKNLGFLSLKNSSCFELYAIIYKPFMDCLRC